MYLKNEIIKNKLSKEDYKKYLYFKDNYLDFDEDILNKYIKIIKDFAFSKSCEEYVLLFNTINGEIFAKYQTFYKLKNNEIIKDLDSKDLLNSEVDASSLENGGLRDITHAKGVVSIDTNSTPFIINNILYIPSIYKSLDNINLDNKTSLYYSMKELSKIIKEVLNKLNYKVENVVPYLGIEQEFYLIEKEEVLKYKDLKYLNHRLIDYEYFNNSEYLRIIDNNKEEIFEEIKKELEKVNIIPKSIHKEVGINQYEIAPIYKIQNEALDDNKKMRIIIQKVCEKHGYIAVFDDKPYIDLSGSGQHNNYSLFVDDTNALSIDNPHYLLVISAFILAIDKYNELLRVSSSSYSNERRLGSKEAPPSTITISLGEELEKMLINFGPTQSLVLDRNRTAPIAFLGERFEFRILGSSLDSTFFNVCINTMLIDAFKDINSKLKLNYTEQDIIKDIYMKHKRIIYNDNNYFVDLKKSNIDITKYYESIDFLDKYKNIFIDNNIMTKEELEARIKIYYKEYLNDSIKEYQVLKIIIKEEILPFLNKQLIDISKISKEYLNEYNIDKIEFIKQISDKFNNYIKRIDQLLNKVKDTKELIKKLDILSSSTIIQDAKDCYKKIKSMV